MQQRIGRPNLKLKLKSQQVLCQVHNENIIQLNISKNIQLNERLICPKCSNFGQSSLYLSEIENYLYQQHEELELIIDQQQEFTILSNQLLSQLNDIQKTLSQTIKQVEQTMESYQETCNLIIKEQSQKELSQLFQDIVASEIISSKTLQDIALIMYNQRTNDQKQEFKRKQKLNSNQDFIIEQKIDEMRTILSKLGQTYELRKRRFILDQQTKSMRIGIFKKKNPVQLKGHEADIHAIAISDNENLVASVDKKGKIILWDILKGEIARKYDTETQIPFLIFSFDSKLLAAHSRASPQEILIFNLDDQKLTSPYIRLNQQSGLINTRQLIYSQTTTMLFSSNSKFLISGGSSQSFCIWNLESQKCISNYQLDNTVEGLSMSQNLNFISVYQPAGQAHLLNSSNFEDIKSLVKWQAHSKTVYGTAFTPDSQMVLTWGNDIRLWMIKQLLSGQVKIPFKVFYARTQFQDYPYYIRLIDNIIFRYDQFNKVMWNINNGKRLKKSQEETDVFIGYYFQEVSKGMKYLVYGQWNILRMYELSVD